MTESFDAVLAEIRRNGYAGRVELDRLQSAHARELAEQQATIEALRADKAVLLDTCANYETLQRLTEARADAAMGLLRDILPALACEDTYHPCSDLHARVNKLLAQQALAGGERKDG